ncbi:hypothetical protein [Pseudomonas sp. RIT-To-2]|uniref:hypothetical protein n=1 Tax=Pseudomonas sp. RIT-To-2 TaxID=3462541 RepID=UPI0024135501
MTKEARTFAQHQANTRPTWKISINSVIGLKDAVTNLYKAFEGAKDFKPFYSLRAAGVVVLKAWKQPKA